MNIVLGITGSVSAYKAPWLVRDLVRGGHTVRVVMSASARAFVAPLALEATSRHAVIHDPFSSDIQEGGSWHVHMAQWADVMVIAPCSASTLARLTMAQCDTAPVLVACSLPKGTPLIVAPAMDAEMWEHKATQRNIVRLEQDGVQVLYPEHGELASGLVGGGRLPDLATIVDVIEQHAVQETQTATQEKRQLNDDATTTHSSLAGRSIVITAGPTHEPIDTVRSIVNHSTGTMGFALAEAAAARGMLVTLVSGPVSLPTPPGCHRINVTTAQDMFEAVLRCAGSEVMVMAAAVADFTPADPLATKLKKSNSNSAGLTLSLNRTTDILAYAGNHKNKRQVVVGFALETDDVINNARTKLTSKHADMIVANQAGVEHSGFGTGNNTITLVTADTQAPFPPMSKRACAEVILDAVITLGEAKWGYNDVKDNQE